ncbi:NAD(P)-dependent alcohol dehydrogenase [Kineosporia sp. A_224]|uniref:NAD(P)-dependent alcohol dehydrogenase n=1 Tax=Kineosporia sp. A_224 TaxID=1962180 RepID=UPI000B4AABE0
MRAVVRDAYGSPDVLTVREISVPAAGEGEVLVRVHAAGIDRGAIHILTGRPYLMRLAGYGVRRPKEAGLGSELSGVVEAVGPGVTGLSPGDEVFGVGRSTFAQYAVADAAALARKPARASHVEAGAVPTSGTTALQAVRDHGRVQAGQSVLVIGASGGVGSFAVQIARALGGSVTGVASTAKLDFVRSLGAEHVIDYTAGDLTTHGVRYDLVLDIAGNRPLKTLRSLLAPQGTLVFVGGEGGDEITGGLGRQVRPTLISRFSSQTFATFWVARPNTADLETLAQLVENGQVRSAVHRTGALSDVADALRALEHGRVSGKIVVTP